MICIIKLGADQFTAPPRFLEDISGWIIATDMHDARRQAELSGDMKLAEFCYRNEFPRPGKTLIESGWVGEDKYLILAT